MPTSICLLPGNTHYTTALYVGCGCAVVIALLSVKFCVQLLATPRRQSCIMVAMVTPLYVPAMMQLQGSDVCGLHRTNNTFGSTPTCLCKAHQDGTGDGVLQRHLDHTPLHGL